jgi:hypothetical protein
MPVHTDRLSYVQAVSFDIKDLFQNAGNYFDNLELEHVEGFVDLKGEHE